MSSVKDKEMQKVDDIGEGSILGAVANLVNSTIGAGIIALPYAMHNTGFGVGIIMYIVSAIAAANGYLLALKAGQKMRNLNFETLFREVYGSWSECCYSFVLVLNLLGVAAAYILLIGDSITTLVGEAAPNFFLADMKKAMIFVTCCILCKMCKYLSPRLVCLLAFIPFICDTMSHLSSPSHFFPAHFSSSVTSGAYA